MNKRNFLKVTSLNLLGLVVLPFQLKSAPQKNSKEYWKEHFANIPPYDKYDWKNAKNGDLVNLQFTTINKQIDSITKTGCYMIYCFRITPTHLDLPDQGYVTYTINHIPIQIIV